jgi:NitT/TauT family transport system permease protein
MLADTAVGNGRLGRDGVDADLAGLDELDTHVEPTSPIARRVWSALWPKVAAVGLVVLVWQTAIWTHWRKSYQLPGPSAVGRRLWEDLGTGALWAAVGNTMNRAVIGFAIALVVGGVIGIAVSVSKVVRAAIGSLITGLQTMPSIAWFPIAIMLFKLSNGAIYFVVAIGSAPSVANGLVSGIDAMPPLLRRVGRSMGASRVELYRDFVVPAALPSVVAGLKQAWAFAWRSLLAGELLVAVPGIQTIGTRLNYARDFADSEGVLSLIVVILVIGIVVDSLVFNRLEQRILRRRGLGAHC